MSNGHLIEIISINAGKYTTPATGSFYVLKDASYAPWAPYNDNPEGRYNGPCTGSLYLGRTLKTCVNEVGTTGKAAYEVDVDRIRPTKILDLANWCIDNPQSSGSLLIPSKSGGWEPTREIGDWAYCNGYDGILFLSHHNNKDINLLLYRDRVNIQQEFFTSVDLPKEETE